MFCQGIAPCSVQLGFSMDKYTSYEEKTTAGSHELDQLRQIVPGQSQSSMPAPISFGFLLGIGCILVALSISDGLLWQLARDAGGFEISSANRYLLTYGPTAVLVCVVAAWRQLDYFTKVTTPWVSLSQGSAAAHKSVLLDYVSVLQIAAWWRAVSNRHYAVVLTTSGFAMLKLAMLASTGLFVLRSGLLSYDLQTSLDAVLAPPLLNLTNNVAVFDQSLFYSTYGVLIQNLDKPFGLGTRIAYSTFQIPKQLPKNNNFTVEVDAFIPLFECKPALVDILEGLSNSSDQHPAVSYQLTSPACQLLSVKPSLYALNPQMFKCPDKQLSGIMQNINCAQEVFGTNQGVYKLLLMTDIRYSQTLTASDQDVEISQPVTASTWNTEIANSAAIVCRLSYGQQKVKVSGAESGRLQPVVFDSRAASSEDQYTGFSPDDLDSLFRGALSASDEILGSRINEAYSEEYPDPMFKTMSTYVKGSYSTLMNTSVMIEAASEIATQLSAQIAHQYLRANTTKSLTMTVSGLTQRLEITTSAAWIVFGTLSSAAISCVLLAFIRKRQWSLIDVSVAPNALVPLSTTDDTLTKTLIASQSCHEKQLKDLLQFTRMYHTRSDSGTRLISADTQIDAQVLDESLQRWFAPITISWPVMAVAMTMTLSLIIVLEVLQKVSDAHRGFLSLPLLQNDISDALIRVIPALVVILIASLFNCIDFNVLLLTPYHSVRSPKVLDHVPHRALLSKTPLAALWSSIRHGEIPAILSTSAALVGSLLAVIVSGLFFPELTYSSLTEQARLLDYFEPQWLNSVLDDNSASVVVSLIENLNFTFPQNTFDEVALPSLELFSSDQPVMHNSSIVAQLPVWRGQLECIPLVSSNFSIKSSNSRFNNGITINATFGLPSTCPYGGPNGTSGLLSFVHTFTAPQSENSSFVGKLLDLHVGPYDPIQSGAQDELTPTLTSDNPLDCPSLALIYGSVNFSTGQNKIVVEVCSQKLQKTFASMRFSDANFTIDSESAPFVDEAATQYVRWDGQAVTYTMDSDKATAFPYRLQSHFDDVFVVFNSTNGNPFSKIDISRPAVDPFFQGVFFGRSSLPLDLLTLQDEGGLTRVRAGILSFYRRYMAQAISLNMRVTSNASQETREQAISVNLEQGIAQRRLLQNSNSKTILQAMLAFMLVCGLTIQWRFKMRKLLPEATNPCTIWGLMSLWAGSNCHTQTHHQTHTSRGSEATAEPRMMVQLGWWHLTDGRRRYGFEIFPES